MNRSLILLGTVSSLLFSGCGRKQRTIFQFNNHEVVHINKLALPSVQEVNTEKTFNGINISWSPITTPISYSKNNQTFSVEFKGYNVFKLSQNGFIPKKPINKKTVIDTHFFDKHGKISDCYLIKPLFKIHDQIITGTISRIVSSPIH